MYNNKLNKEIERVIVNNNPDKEIEVFWLGLKQSITNFMKIYNIDVPIHTWSNLLNWYQQNKDYENIKIHIHIFISYYAVNIFKFADSYHTSILWTNVKRWNKITDNFRFEMNNYENKDNIFYFNIYHLLLDIYRTILCGNNNNIDVLDFFKDIDENIMEYDLYTLIDLSIKHDLGNILDKINLYKDFTIHIENKYNIDIPYKMSGKKIINKINLN